MPLGKTLFEGDIGSGKSTLLMAIEFALFGLGSETGSSLLKLGEQNGEVKMKFEVEGNEYEVRRGLERKGAGVQQTEGDFGSPEEKLALSPRELKERILDVLEFNEAPDPKAQSLIYRYAIYTPQEEMKEVLSMSPDYRLQTLRRAFRVEDYKTAAENATDLARQMRGDIRELEGFGTGLDRLKEQLDELMKGEEEQRTALATLESEESVSETGLKALKTEKDRLHEEEVSMEGLRAEKQMQERAQRERGKELSRLETEIGELQKRTALLQEALELQKGKRPPTRKTPAQLRALATETEAKVRRLTAVKAKVESKLGDYVSMMDKGVCPVCDRPVEGHDFDDKKAAKETEREHVSDELSRAEGEVDRIREAVELVQKYLAEKGAADEKRAEMARLKKQVRDKEKDRAGARRKEIEAKARLADLAEKVRRLEELTSDMAEVDAKIARAEEALRKVRDKLARAGERLQQSDRRRAELTIEIVAKEGAGARRDALKENEIWLADYFVPTIQLIEKSVLAAINQEFDALFQKWFSMLVNDPDKEVRIDEGFTPIVAQDGYEQEVRYLSGGERTSVALAYRLALNTLARRISAGMKSNLLILDEPTDGFSHEQLGNVREVLDDMGSPQVIIVSHDKELESFADQILRVRKTGGVSTIEAPAVS